MGRQPLTVRRLLGLDRSGPPPPRTGRGDPLNPWTIPNAIGFARLLMIPPALVIGLGDEDGRNALATVLFGVAGFSDYFDGMVARITGQFSRLGKLLDPLIDRLLVISICAVIWKFDLLPRWAIALLIAREVFMLGFTRLVLARGGDIEVRQVGRFALFFTGLGLWFSLITGHPWVEVLFFAGLGLTLLATVLYVREAVIAASRPSTSA